MRARLPNHSWLPPREEWDFRAVTQAECRVACNWEYSRDIHRITKEATRPFEDFPKPPAPQIHCPAFYRRAARTLFPQPWLSLTKQQRAAILDSFCAIPAVQVRKLGDFFRHTQWAEGAHLDVLQPYLEHSYVVQPNFSLFGIETVIKELEIWARKEAKNYPRAPRAKAAALPFDVLKWLAVSRLEDARREARVSFDDTQQALPNIGANTRSRIRMTSSPFTPVTAPGPRPGPTPNAAASGFSASPPSSSPD